MDHITIRETRAELPVFDEEVDLEELSSLSTAHGTVSDFQFSDATVRVLELKNGRLLQGKVCAIRAERADFTGMHLNSVEFTGCDLASLRWVGGKVSRARFDGCKLLGARFEDVALENVVFTNCKMDYATLDQIRATGPVLFAHCSLREAECTESDLTGCLFDDCDLHLANFGRGTYRRCDLRGNDLSVLNSTRHLRRVIIDRAQTIQLGEALAMELDVTFGDDT